MAAASVCAIASPMPRLAAVMTTGVDYCKRKVSLVRDNMEKLIEVISTKRKQATQVQQVFAMKMQAMEAAQAKQNEVGA